MRQLNFVVSGPKSKKSFTSNAGEILVSNGVLRLSISRSVPQIFAMEVQSCPKSGAVFGLGGNKTTKTLWLTKVHQLITPFLLVEILIRSGDVGDQILKLSEIVPNFRCFCPPKLPKKLYLNSHARPEAPHVETFREVTPLGSNVLSAHGLNFWPILKFVC